MVVLVVVLDVLVVVVAVLDALVVVILLVLDAVVKVSFQSSSGSGCTK